MQAGFVSKILFKGKLEKYSYLNRIPVVQQLKQSGELSFHSNITFLVGENGTGKSTLLEAMAVACGFNPEGGTKNYMFSTKDTHSELHDHLTIVRRRHAKWGYFLRAESFYNTSTYLDKLTEKPKDEHELPSKFSGYGNKLMHVQSHGESFLHIIEHCFSSEGIYFLDEPEAALSVRHLFQLMTTIHELAQKGSQFIIATHSPILMSIPGSVVLELSNQGICEIDYKETEHFQLSQQFYTDPERMLYYLFK